jgi:hypothetical protein
MTPEYYQDLLQKSTKVQLVALVKRNVSYAGAIPTFSGNKPVLTSKIKETNMAFMVQVTRTLTPVDQSAVDSALTFYERTPAMEVAVVCTVNVTLSVRRNTLKQLLPAKPILCDLMQVLLEMLRLRDSRVCSSYLDRSNKDMKVSKFYGPNFFQEWKPGDQQWDDVYEVYICNKDPNRDIWTLLIVNIADKKISYINPRDRRDVLCEDATLKMKYYEVLLHPILSDSITNCNINWKCKQYPYQYYAPVTNDFDSGMYTFIILYFCVHNCPLAFQAERIPFLRNTISYWIMCGSLPY